MNLSPAAGRLVEAAFADLDPDRVTDHHVHVVGTGTEGAATWVNPRMRSWRHPVDRVRYLAYRGAAGGQEEARADAGFAERLTSLVDEVPGRGRFLLLAFDWRHRADGTIDRSRSEFRVGDERAFEVAATRPERFAVAISVHPYRKDAVAALEAGAARGARVVKWLPNAMGIDPADPACDAAYRAMRELDLTLLCHTGKELAVSARADQELGNPLRLRRALDAGVTVVAAHCGSLGKSRDLDDPAGRPTPSFDLFLRLMGEERYRGRLFGELSALTLANRFHPALGTLLEREDLHGRLVNGSDWPIPAVNVTICLGALVRRGYLAPEEKRPLAEIWAANPLLFDYVLKRRVRHPRTGARFPPEVFLAREKVA